MRARVLCLLTLLVLLAALSASAKRRPRKQRPVQQITKHERHHKPEHCHKHKHKHHNSPRPKSAKDTKSLYAKPSYAKPPDAKPLVPKSLVANPTGAKPPDAKSLDVQPLEATPPVNDVKIPLSRSVAIQGDLFFLAKMMQCPADRELKCRDSWCARLTCSEAGLYSLRVCPRLPRSCDSLYCSCANSQGYFRESNVTSRCVHKSQCVNGARYRWANFSVFDVSTTVALDNHWSKAGYDQSGVEIYILRSAFEHNLLPGTYIMAVKGYVTLKNKTDIEVKTMEILSDPFSVLKWVPYTSGVIPVTAVKAGYSEDGIPQYIGKKDYRDENGDVLYTVTGRVDLGQLWHSASSEPEKEFDILCDRDRKKLG